MTTHLVRDVDKKTRKPVVNMADNRSGYFVECDQCGRLNQRGLSRRAAAVRATAHTCRQAT